MTVVTHDEVAEALRRLAAKNAKPISPLDVLTTWEAEGPLVHEPTGLRKLDELTDGGPVYGSRWYLTGAPDAGKTALLIQIADTFLTRGVSIGLLAVDEEPGDIVTRLLQRRGVSRRDCEAREPHTLSRGRDMLAKLPLRLYDSSWTIERAGADIAALARERSGRPFGRAMLGVDSIQVVSTAGDVGASSVREAVTARVVALRATAQQHRLIGIATSEMNRSAYRTADAGESTDDMASAKESGAIEYSARVMLALRSVAGEPDLVELRVAKNKHGPKGESMHLKLDRRLQELTPAESPVATDESTAKKERREATARKENLEAAIALVRCLLVAPGTVTRELAGLLRTQLGACSEARASTALHMLGAGAARVEGPHRSLFVYLNGASLPAEVVAALSGQERIQAIAARPPEGSSQ